MQLTEARLLARVKAGEVEAFESIYNTHWRMVYSILFRLIGRREEAEDLAQEVFVKLYRTPPQLGERETVAPWLYRVATNLGYNTFRAGSRQSARDQRAETLAQVELSAGTGIAGPEDASLIQEERLAVRRALSQLSEREQACLVLRHSGLSYAEVGAAIGVRASSVGTLLARAEERFRGVYERQQEVPDGLRG